MSIPRQENQLGKAQWLQRLLVLRLLPLQPRGAIPLLTKLLPTSMQTVGRTLTSVCHLGGKRDAPMTTGPTLSTIARGQQHGTILGAIQQSHPPSLRFLLILVHCHRDGRCVSHQHRACILWTTIPTRRLGTIQEPPRSWMRMLPNISVITDGILCISALSRKCVC